MNMDDDCISIPRITYNLKNVIYKFSHVNISINKKEFSQLNEEIQLQLTYDPLMHKEICEISF